MECTQYGNNLESGIDQAGLQLNTFGRKRDSTDMKADTVRADPEGGRGVWNTPPPPHTLFADQKI